MKQVIGCTILAALALTAPIAANAARNGFQTKAVSNSAFEVIPRGRTDIDGYWCAAADFARRSLGAGWQQRIYVTRGYGPSVTTGRKTAVQFSIAPPEAGVTQQSSSGFFSGFRPGENMSVQGANGRCHRRPLID